MNFISSIKYGYGYELRDYVEELAFNGNITPDVHYDVIEQLDDNKYYRAELMGDHTINLKEDED